MVMTFSRPVKAFAIGCAVLFNILVFVFTYLNVVPFRDDGKIYESHFFGITFDWKKYPRDPVLQYVIVHMIIIVPFVSIICSNYGCFFADNNFSPLTKTPTVSESSQSDWKIDWDSNAKPTQMESFANFMTVHSNGEFTAQTTIDSNLSDDHCPVCLCDWNDLIGDTQKSFVVVLPCSHQICLHCLVVTHEAYRLEDVATVCVLCREGLKFELNARNIAKTVIPLRFVTQIGKVSRILQYPGDEIADATVGICVKAKMDISIVESVLKMMRSMKPLAKPWKFEQEFRHALLERIHRSLAEGIEENNDYWVDRGSGRMLAVEEWKERSVEAVIRCEIELYAKATNIREYLDQRTIFLRLRLAVAHMRRQGGIRVPLRYDPEMGLEARLNTFESLLGDHFLLLLDLVKGIITTPSTWSDETFPLPISVASPALLCHLQHMLVLYQHEINCQQACAEGIRQRGKHVCRYTPNCERLRAVRVHHQICLAHTPCLHRDCFHLRVALVHQARCCEAVCVLCGPVTRAIESLFDTEYVIDNGTYGPDEQQARDEVQEGGVEGEG